MEIQFNFFTIGSLIGAIFAYYIAILFLRVKDKSRETMHMGLAIFWVAMFHTGYTLGFLFPAEASIYHRWLIIPTPLFGSAQLCIFFTIHKEEGNPKRLPRMVGFVLYAVAVLVSIYYYLISSEATRVYLANSHYFDFKLVGFYKFYAILVLFYFFLYIVLGIRNVLRVESRYKLSTGTILGSFMIVTIIPGILNALSRDGAVSRALYQSITDLCLVVGLFANAVAYINTTTDRTRILSRITAISMASILLVLQMVAYFAISDKETSYDSEKFKEARLAVLNREYPSDLGYLQYLDINSGQIRSTVKKSDADLVSESYKNEFLNTAILDQWNRIPKSSDPISRGGLEKTLASSHPGFSGYKALVRKFIEGKESKSESISAQDIILYLSSLERKIAYTRNKILQLEDTEISGWLDKNRESGGWLGDFLSGIPQLESRDELVQYFAPAKKSGSRNYRGRQEYTKSDPVPKFLVSYFLTDIDSNRIYEVGFSYDQYMKYIDQTGRVIVVIVLLTVLFVWLGFRYFFSGALIYPLSLVVDGLKEVNEGNLNTKLPIKVEDEIGFLARSFNSMVESIRSARKALEEYAENLELKVEERTRELQNTLNEVQSLKLQQDGDYFLTSLLIKPLSSNQVYSDKVHVEFFIKQKKQFSFRKYQEEIGGDINIASTIRLKGKKFSAFLNADAMGKSMQGAGGALVIGSVFESIIERTKVSSEVQNSYPERWLKNAFIELHKVFESFNGSMLVSLVIGLVEDSTGMVYFINAEHPFSILFRDGKAEFIETDMKFRKLGTSGVEGNLSIDTFALKPGDSFIVGSDGKDDLVLERFEDGSRIINEDENLFLQILEEAKGDLEETYKILLSRGELSDDLSLLKITYQAEESEKEIPESVRISYQKGKEFYQRNQIDEAIRELEEALESSDRDPKILKKLSRIYLKAGNFSQALSLLMEYSGKEPGDTESIYLASLAARKVGDLRTSVDLGERVRLRLPQYGENLLNLAKSHLLLKNIRRANAILLEAQETLPEHPGIKKLLQLTEKKLEGSKKAV